MLEQITRYSLYVKRMKYPGVRLMDMLAINKFIVLFSMIVRFFIPGGLINVSQIVNKEETWCLNRFECHL